MKRFAPLLLPLALVSAAPAIADASAPKLGEFKTFKDWAVACNNVRTCTALALLPEDGENAPALWATLHFSRSGKPNALPELSLIWTDAELPEKAIGKPILLRMGKDNLSIGKLTPQQQKTGNIRIPAASATKLLAGLPKAETLEVTLAGQTQPISLNGLNATLLYIDEQQQRLGTNSALLRKGNKSMTAQPPALPAIPAVLPPSTALPVPTGLPEMVRRLAPAAQECETEQEALTDFAVALDTKHYLVGLACGMGAYNTNTRLFIVPKPRNRQTETTIQPAVLEQQTGNDITNLDFNAKTGILSEYNKARGLGDCGVYSEWVWDGKQFLLLKRDVMESCMGIREFLNIWQAKTKS